MRNILVEIMYNGTNYCGFQVQDNAISICSKIQDALQKLFFVRYDIKGCSRTDSQVHANQYFLTFKTDSNIKDTNIKRALNTYLPKDITIINCRDVSLDFHPRYNAIKKQYIYKIYNTDFENPFLVDFAYHYRKPIDVDIINNYCEKLIGVHDFAGFSKKSYEIKDTVREIFDCKFYLDEGFNYIFSITGNKFLHNMVRIIVGTALSVNEGKIILSDIDDIFIVKDRTKAGNTMPSNGLYLNKVEY
ncbi:MAG: tRNA pseudouridine(38-40) synthase TruA [Oscillospiraceae bacterium]